MEVSIKLVDGTDLRRSLLSKDLLFEEMDIN